MAQTVSVKSGGVWRTVTNVAVKVGGVWQESATVYVKSGGVWRDAGPIYQQTTSWDTDASQAYRGNDNQRSTDYLYQGDYSGGTYGMHKSWIGFDDANIRSVLAGRTIEDVDLRLSSEHFYRGDFNNPIGWTRHGTHTSGTKPATWSAELHEYTHGTYGHEHTWPGGFGGARDQTQTINLPNAIGEGLRDDVFRALTLHSHNTSDDYYCYFFGVNNSTSSTIPKLTIQHNS